MTPQDPGMFAKAPPQRLHCVRQRGAVVFMTGLSGAGKSTIAGLVDEQLQAMGLACFTLDGDLLRTGLGADLGFSEADRAENVRRTGEVAKLMAEAGLLVICALIAPFRIHRAAVRARLPAGSFMEVFVDAPLSVCESRDPKGLYRRARLGQIADFTGLDSPYEAPESAELRIDTARLTPQESARLLVDGMRRLRMIGD
jgi:adenylyl-sulfate kinase